MRGNMEKEIDIRGICPHCMREMKDKTAKYCVRCGKAMADRECMPHQLPPFTVLKGKYLVGKVLGQGGFGITYIGMDMTLKMPVAIKELYPDGLCTRDGLQTAQVTLYDKNDVGTVQKWKERFEKEALSLAKCSGLVGIVAVKEFFEENNTAYIVQEYLDGPDLSVYRKKCGGKISADILLPAMKSIITSLGMVHEEELIHRDISPDNIKRLATGEMKLFDFGAARDYAAENDKTVMLKHGYAPEEQYRSNGEQGPWTDVYALAATMYECLTGVKPPDSMDRLYLDELKRPNELGAGISIQIENALMKAMAVRAENRYQSMTEFYQALYEAPSIQDAYGETQDRRVEKFETAAEQKQNRSGFKRKRKAFPVVAGIGLLFLCIAGFFFLRDTRLEDVSDSIKDRFQKESEMLSEQENTEDTEPINVEEEIENEIPETSETAEVEISETEQKEKGQNDFLIEELSDGTVAVKGYTGEKTELLIPEQVDGKKVTVIQKLENDTVEVMTVPGSVISIDENAIVSKSIRKIILRDGIQRLSDGAFQDCKNLQEINLPKSIENMGAAVFSADFIEKQSESRGIYYIDGIALAIKANQTEFKWSSHTRGIAGDFWKTYRGSNEFFVDVLEIPDGVEFIGKGAFRCVHASRIYVPQSVKEIGRYSLGCNAEKVPYADVVISGQKGSEAEKYAKENNILFEQQ